MKIQVVLLLILIIFTNRHDGTVSNQSTPQPPPLPQVTSNPTKIMTTNATANSPINITTTTNTTMNITVNTTANPNVTHWHCTVRTTWENDVYFVLILLFIPVVFLGNFVVVVVVFNTRTLRSQPMYLFLASLAVADCLIGIFLFPFRAKLSQDGNHFELPTFLCWLFWLCDTLINLVSILHFVVVALDRYVALKYTYDYSNMITRKRALLIITMIWTFSTVWTLIGIPQWTWIPPGLFPDPLYKVSIYNLPRTGCGTFNQNFHITTLVLWVLLPIVFLFFLYSFIYRTALRHVNEISRLHVGEAEKMRRNKQLQLVRSIVAVFVSYALCWIPMSVLNLWFYANKAEVQRLNCSGSAWFKVVDFICSKLFIVVCPNANPFIYVLTNAAFVTALKRLFRRITGIELGKKDSSMIQSEITKQTDEIDDSHRMKNLGRGNNHVTGTINEGSAID